MYIDYNLYDNIVAKTLEAMLKMNKGKKYIITEYKDNVIDNYILHLLFMSSDMTKKQIYVKTDIITYLKLKIRYYKKRKIKLCCFNEEYIIPEELADYICKEQNQSISVIDEIYKTYYSYI